MITCDVISPSFSLSVKFNFHFYSKHELSRLDKVKERLQYEGKIEFHFSQHHRRASEDIKADAEGVNLSLILMIFALAQSVATPKDPADCSKSTFEKFKLLSRRLEDASQEKLGDKKSLNSH